MVLLPRLLTFSSQGATVLQMLFGGRSSDIKYYYDVWSWDGREWTVQSPDSLKKGPQPRDHSSMAYNNGQLIVWGEPAPFDPVFVEGKQQRLWV